MRVQTVPTLQEQVHGHLTIKSKYLPGTLLHLDLSRMFEMELRTNILLKSKCNKVPGRYLLLMVR
jgi:hypothetical protein